MSNPYTEVTVTGYNTSPPADDGTEVASNQVTWAKHKDKIGDPLKTAIEAIDDNVAIAFGKLPWYATRAISTNDSVLIADERKLLSCTNTITVTLLAAATAGVGFTVTILNAGTGVITIDGDSSETINGSITHTLSGQYSSVHLFCDGSSWTIVTAAPRGQQVLIGTASASASATVDFSWANQTYSKILVVLTNVTPATDDVQLWVRTSTDGGSTYDSGAAEYEWTARTQIIGGGTNTDFSTGDTQIVLTATSIGDMIGNGANESWSGTVEIIGPAVAGYTRVLHDAIYTDASAGAGSHTVGGGSRLAAEDVDGIQFLMSSGNIASGQFAVYGLV